MSLLSTVTVDAPAHANYRITWCQPVKPGDLLTDWVLVATGARVNRFRLSTEVYFCSVRTNGAANAGTVTWNIGIGGPATAEQAYGSTPPNLTGSRLTVRGQNGAAYVASIASQAVEDTLREGLGWKEVRRWTHTTNASDVDGGGNPWPVNGVHTYLHFRDDTPCIQGEIRITNASITVGSYGAANDQAPAGQNFIFPSQTSFYGTVFFNETTLTPPAGYAVLFERPFWANPGNCHLPRMGYVRRFVFYPVTTNVAEAQALLDLKGIGLVYSGRSYFNTEAHCAHGSLLVDLDQPGMFPGGFAGLKTSFESRYQTLLQRANQGLYDPNADTTSPYGDFWRAPLGPFRPLGDWNALPPGVVGTAPDAGMPYVISAVKYWRLFHDCSMEGSGYWVLHKTTGRPVTTQDFGNAAIGHGWSQNPQGLCPENNNQPGNPNPAGRMPFHYDVQGYDFSGSSGIPGLSDTVPGQASSGMDPQPSAKPLTTGACGFLTDLYKWRARYAASHYIQHTNRAKVLAYQLGDLVAIDDIHMMAENAGYAWSETGALPNIYYQPGNLASLKDYKVYVEANPGQALIWLGREAGWVAESYALAWALGDDARRAFLLPRLKLMHDVYVSDVAPCGAYGRQAWNGQFGIFLETEAWTPPTMFGNPGDPTQPAPANEEVYSVDIQSDLFAHGLFAVCRQLKNAGDVGFSLARPLMVRWLRQILQPFKADGVTLRWTPSEYQTQIPDVLDRSHGPAKYGSVCGGPPGSGIPDNNTVLEFYDVEANPNVLDDRFYLGGGIGITYAPHMIEILWRVAGNVQDLNKIKILGKAPNSWPVASQESLTTRAQELMSGDQNPYTMGEFQVGLAGFMILFESIGYVPEDSVATLPPIVLTPTPAASRLSVPAITTGTHGLFLLPSSSAISLAAPAVSISVTAGNIVLTPAASGVRFECPFPAVTFDTVEIGASASGLFDLAADVTVMPSLGAAIFGNFGMSVDIAVYPQPDLGGDGDLFEDARSMLLDLLPPGIAWTRAASAVLTHVLEGAAEELAQVLQRARDLIRESDPRTTFELLPDWERVAGLPDPCAGPQPTVIDRRAGLVAKLTSNMPPTPAALKAFAAALGYDVEITEFRPFQAGRSVAGDALTNSANPFEAGRSLAGDPLRNGLGWDYVFQVSAPIVSLRHFVAGSHAGDALANWTNAVLECEINRAKPAHTLAIFSYGLLLGPDATSLLISVRAPVVARVLTLAPTPGALRTVPPNIVRALVLAPTAAAVRTVPPNITVA